MPEIIKSDFITTIREEFSEYLLDDGNTLKIKNVLVSIGRTKETKTEAGKTLVKALFQFHPVTGIISTGKVDVSKLELKDPPPIITTQDRQSQIGFKAKRNILNLYETEQLLIVTRDELTGVWTTQFKDKTETPIYSVEMVATGAIIPKKDLGPM